MKELRIEVPVSRDDELLDILDDYNINYSSLVLDNNKKLYLLKVKDDTTNFLLHELQSRGIGEIFGEISIVQLNMFMQSSQTSDSLHKSQSANLEEIVATLEDSATLSWGYITLVILAAALAAYGLLSNSVVIIIGSMIVAPLLGPVALTSLGLLVPERGYLKKGIVAEGIGILATVFIGFLVGIADNLTLADVTQEMRDRASEASEYNIIFAIVSGIAAGVIISKGQGLSIVGVAIAASLAPPAANIGLYLSIGSFEDAWLTTVLLLMNILAINASCSLIFMLFRLPSKSGYSKRKATRTRRNVQALTVVVMILFIVIAYIFYSNAINT